MTLESDTKFEEKLTVEAQTCDYYGVLYPKQKMYELKVHKGVMCYDNEER